MGLKMPMIFQKLYTLLDAFLESMIRRVIRLFEVVLDALAAAVSNVRVFVVTCIAFGFGFDILFNGKFGIIKFSVGMFKEILGSITANTSTAVVFVGLLFLIYGITKK